MTIRRGTSLLDLLPQTTDIAGFLPDDVIDRIGILTVLDHRSMISDAVVFHSGVLQDAAEVRGSDFLDFGTEQWGLKIPGVNTGLPFRMAVRRGAPAASPDQEPSPVGWVLDILVQGAELLFPSGVRPAVLAGGVGTNPLHLEPDSRGGRVAAVVSGVVRISGGGANGTEIQVIDNPDPFDPDAPAGAVVRLTFRPPHFVFGDSQYGFSVEDFLVDLSRGFTPANVIARGQDESWEGVAFKNLSFYFPPATPIVGSLSIGAHDWILGWSPFGLQGELQLELGRDFDDWVFAGTKFFLAGTDTELHQEGGLTRTLEVTLPEPATEKTPIQIDILFGLNAQPKNGQKPGIVRWRPPGEAEQSATIPSKVTTAVKVGDVLRYRVRIFPEVSTPDSEKEAALLSEVSVKFVSGAQPGPGDTPASFIDVVIGTAAPLKNVAHVRGDRQALAAITFQTSPSDPKADWKLEGGSQPESATDKPTFKPQSLPAKDGQYQLTLSSNKHTRHLVVEIAEGAPLLVGHRNADGTSGQVSTSPGGTVTISNIETFSLADFHNSGATNPQEPSEKPALPPPQTALVAIPKGILGRVKVPTQIAGTTPTTSVAGFAVFFEFSNSQPSGRSGTVNSPPDDNDLNAFDTTKHVPDAIPLIAAYVRNDGKGSSLTAAVKSWVQGLTPNTGRKYFVVGRSDDLWGVPSNLDANNRSNADLAGERAEKVRGALVDAGVPASDIAVRTEQGPLFSASGVPDRLNKNLRLAMPSPDLTQAPGPFFNKVWSRDDKPNTGPHDKAITDRTRFPYRSVEIFTTPPPSGSGGAGVPGGSILVPGQDGDPTPRPGNTTEQEPPLNYRLRLRVKWDSPTVHQLSDAIPTMAELVVDLKATQPINVPGNTGAQATPVPPASGRDFWELLLRYTFDARTGTTEVTGSAALPDGQLSFTGDAVAGVLAFGPALSALVDRNADTSSDDAKLQWLKTGALMGVGAAIGAFLNQDGQTPSRVDLQRFEVKYRWDSTSFLQATVDYLCTLQVNIDEVGLSGKDIKIRYKNVGLRFNIDDDPGLDGLGLVYDRLSVEMQDMGVWKFGDSNKIGQLLRVASARLGAASVWIELDLAFALDLGVIRLEGATVRITVLPEQGAELRGLRARVSIPGAIEGSGALTIGDGEVRALLSLEIIPAKISAYGALAIKPPMVAIEVGVRFPVGIPIGATGLGIFGFMGRFVANGKRDLTGLTAPDPVQRELAWYERSPELKYSPLSGQYAIGLGAVIGTMPDTGFTLNAEGSFCIAFPDISVVFGVKAVAFIPPNDAKETGSGGDPSVLKIVGMTIVDDQGVRVALRGSYTVPKLLDVNVPVSANFPKAATGQPWFIRIGSDNGPGRPGDPVSMKLFPGSIERKGTGFLLVEERGIVRLDNTDISLSGFSIGLGARFGVDWSAGPVRLTASAGFALGIGTKPLLVAGVVDIRGELSLTVVSLSLRGSLKIRYQDGHFSAQGEFCGGIDCWFFSIEGCIDVTIVDTFPNDPPPPSSPLSAGIDLCDHRAVIKGKLAAGDGTGDLPVVWPDTVPVIHFGHPIQDGLNVSPSFKVQVPETYSSPWSGATELKYAYRLDSVQVFRLNAGGNVANDTDWTLLPGRFDAAWWFPTGRAPFITGEPLADIAPSTEEGRELGLFWWHPAPWSRSLDRDGGAGLPGDPARPFGKVCDTPPAVLAGCAYGMDAKPQGLLRVRVLSRPQTVPIPSVFTAQIGLDARLPAQLLLALTSGVGYVVDAPGVVTLDHPAPVDGGSIPQGWRIPAFRVEGRFLSSLPMDAAISPGLRGPELTLQVCTDAQRDQRPVDVGVTGGARVCDTFTIPEATRVVHGLPTTSGTVILPEMPTETITTITEGVGASIVSPAHGLRVTFPAPASQVSVAAFAGRGLVIQAIDDTGTIVDSVTMLGAGLRHVDLAGTRIVALHMIPGSGASGPGPGPGPGPGTGPGSGLGVGSSFDVGQCSCICAPTPVPPGAGGGLDGTGGTGGTGSNGGGQDGGPPRIQEICRTTSGLDVTVDPGIVIPTTGDLPVVVGVLPTGEEVPFTGTPLEQTTPCRHVTFRPVDPTVEWTSIRIKAWNRGPLTVVSLCGVIPEAADHRAADQAVRDALKNLPGLFGRTGPTATTPTRVVALEAGSVYQIRVTWHYQVWEAPNTGAKPPTLSGTWKGGTTERFTFRTADWGVTAPAEDDPSDLAASPSDGGPGFDERTFDARGLARYITFSQPTDGDLTPHFTGDELAFGFMVDHLDKLLQKYGATLSIQVLRTDPPAGALNGVPPHEPGEPHALDVSTGFTLVPDGATWFPAERRIQSAFATAPCVGQGPRTGSSTAHVDATLEPRASYDLLLLVLRQDEEIAVARAHFRTSRYAQPADLVRALGFAIGTQPLSTPDDFIIPGTVPTLPTGSGDGAMDDTLRALGLDPWPVPTDPRVTAIWQPPSVQGGTWALVGVLLEADEPLERDTLPLDAAILDSTDPRLRMRAVHIRQLDDAGNTTTTNTMNQQLRNASGTRVLLHAGAPIPLPVGGVFHLQLEVGSRLGAIILGTALLNERPLTLIQEGR